MTDRKEGAVVDASPTATVAPVEEKSRRAMISKLLGVAAGGAALQALAGCLAPGAESESENEETGSNSDALKGTTIFWVDAIGTAPISTSGSENLRGLTGSAGEIAIVEGYLTKGDGGGGVFYWDSTSVVDDGGTIIVSGQNLGSSTPGSAWRRLYSGPLNVQWFGAIPQTFIDCQPAIQRAIAASMSTMISPHTNTIYFPAGEYRIETTIEIPRSELRPITLRGEGRGVSILMGAGLDNDEPVIGFDSGTASSFLFTLEGFQISRFNAGRVFEFAPTVSWTAPPYGANRLSNATFRDIVFYSPNNEGWGTEPVVYIEGGQEISFENVLFCGGNVAVHFHRTSYCTMIKCVIGANGFGAGDGSTANGMLINASGHFKASKLLLTGFGSENNPGYGIRIDDDGVVPHLGPAYIMFDSLSGEGDDTLPFIEILAGTHITFLNTQVPYARLGDTYPNGKLVWIGAAAKHVRFIGGSLPNYYSAAVRPGARALFVESGATDIYFDDVCVGDDFGEFTANVEVQSGATRVRLNLLQGSATNPWRQVVKAKGVIPTLPNTSYNPSVYGGTVFQVQSGHNIGNLTDGYDGQIVTLLVPPGSQIVPFYGFQLAADAYFSPTHHSTIQFVYDGSVWREISRCESGTT